MSGLLTSSSRIPRSDREEADSIATLTDFFCIARQLAAIIIQRIYRGHMSRRRQHRVLILAGNRADSNVQIAGNFTDWKPHLMHWAGPSVGHAFRVPPWAPQRLVFKFLVDGSWTLSPDFDTQLDISHNLNNVSTGIPDSPLSPKSTAASWPDADDLSSCSPSHLVLLGDLPASTVPPVHPTSLARKYLTTSAYHLLRSLRAAGHAAASRTQQHRDYPTTSRGSR